MTVANERKFLYWFIGILLSVISFIGVLGVNAIMSMNRTINRIEIKMASDEEKDKNIQYRVELLEHKK